MKKITSVFLAFCIVLPCLATGFTAFAKQNESVTVSYSVCDNGMFTFEPTDVSVTSDLSDKYAEQIGYNDTLSVPTVLDATIATHIAMFGEDFMDYAPLGIYSSGWLYSAFGEDASASGYRSNGNSLYSLDTEVKDNDYVEFFFYQDTYSWSDKYVTFDSRQKTTVTNAKLDLSLTAEGYDSSYNVVVNPATSLDITCDGETIATTNEKGVATVTFSKAGTYKLTASGEVDGSPIVLPYCEVTVVDNDLFNYIAKETKAGAKYLLNGVTSIDTSSAVDFLTYLESGYDMSSLSQGFVDSVKTNLSTNNGKLLTAQGNEDIGLYGAVIVALTELGYDAKDFEGYNIVNAFSAIDTSAEYHPYYYRVAIKATTLYSFDEEFVDGLCNSLISNYYTDGKGVNYYGYSCDNTAYFVATLAPYKDKYSAKIDDALSVIESYTNSKGAFYSNTYSDVNSNSTALAVMAYASVGDNKNAYKMYKCLVKSYESSTGVFTYNNADNVYSTKDALLSLEYFAQSVANANYQHPSHIEVLTSKKSATTSSAGYKKYTCKICSQTRTEEIAKLSLKEQSISTAFSSKNLTMSSVGKSYKLNAKAKTTLSYKSSNTSVATVDKNGVVKIKGEGTAVITITASKSSTYKSATKKVTIKVTRKTIKYKATANLYYRTGAGTNYKAVGKFKKGQTVYVLEKTEKKDKQSRTWVKVKVNGKTYWCCKSYLKKA